MINFGDSIYYLDLKAFEKAITLVDTKTENSSTDVETKQIYDGQNTLITTEVFTRKPSKGKEIDATKYDLFRTFIEYIIDSEEVDDDSLGQERALKQTSLGYKIVFNTLYKEGIIKEKEA